MSNPTLDRITPQSALLFLCDIQETFRGKIIDYEYLISSSSILTQCAKLLHIPIVATEQQPFKPTVAEIDVSGVQMFKKTKFSMCTQEIMNYVKNQDRKHIILFGIEAHVCVLQTTLDLLRDGYVVYLPLDCVSSQNTVDRDAALSRLSKHPNVVFTSVESVMFEMLADAKHDSFKSLIPLMKQLGDLKKQRSAKL